MFLTIICLIINLIFQICVWQHSMIFFPSLYGHLIELGLKKKSPLHRYKKLKCSNWIYLKKKLWLLNWFKKKTSVSRFQKKTPTFILHKYFSAINIIILCKTKPILFHLFFLYFNLEFLLLFFLTSFYINQCCKQ